MSDLHSRRVFLRAAATAGAAWAIADLSHVEDALSWAAQTAVQKKEHGFTALTSHEAGVISAVAARILPSVDGRPGARETGVIYFIDRSLSTFNAAKKSVYSEGVKDLDARTAAKRNGLQSFAALASAEQDELLREIEQTPFFKAVRFDTIAGMFALPSWGGNRDFAGWRLLGMTHQARYDPPFGYYDAEANKVT
jgi:gluconate 2-dehydrogenase gamma chain